MAKKSLFERVTESPRTPSPPDAEGVTLERLGRAKETTISGHEIVGLCYQGKEPVPLAYIAGADWADAFIAAPDTAAERDRLKERCDGYKGQVKYGATEITRLKASNKALVKALEKVAAWLDRQTVNSENQAASTNLFTLRESCEADAKNYAATAKSIRAVLAKHEEG